MRTFSRFVKRHAASTVSNPGLLFPGCFRMVPTWARLRAPVRPELSGGGREGGGAYGATAPGSRGQRGWPPAGRFDQALV